MFEIENHCRETGFSQAESMTARRSITRQGGPEPLVGVEQLLRLLSEGAPVLGVPPSGSPGGSRRQRETSPVAGTRQIFKSASGPKATSQLPICDVRFWP